MYQGDKAPSLIPLGKKKVGPTVPNLPLPFSTSHPMVWLS